MKTMNACWLVIAGLIAGVCVASVRPTVDAQTIPNVVQHAPRYQISAWAYAGNPSIVSPKEGYYIVDTITGDVWKSDSSEKAVKVSGKLQ